MTVNQYIFIWVSIIIILLAYLSCSSSSLQSFNKLELKSESSKYQICYIIKIIKTFWCKWTVNLQDRSFINRLDWQWDSQWRTDCCSELQFYSLWLKIIKKIRYIAQMQKINEKTAMQQISKQQQNMQCLLNWLCKLLRADRKTWSSK